MDATKIRDFVGGTPKIRDFVVDASNIGESVVDTPKQMNKEYLFKVIVAGEGGVGKTTFINRYIDNDFIQDTKITIGVSFHSFANKINNGETLIKLQIWDFGGERRFRFLLPSYCKGAHGIIFAFDLTRPTSLWKLDEWFDLVKKNTNTKPTYLLIGTKADLIQKNDSTMLNDEQISKFLEKHDMSLDQFFKTSSLTGENITDVFAKITKHLSNRIKYNGDKQTSFSDGNSIERGDLAYPFANS